MHVAPQLRSPESPSSPSSRPGAVLQPTLQPKLHTVTYIAQELLRLEEACAAAGLNTYLIRDAGHTEIEPGSRTVLAALARPYPLP